MPTKTRKPVTREQLQAQRVEANLAVRAAQIEVQNLENRVDEIEEAIKSGYAREADVEALQHELFEVREVLLKNAKLKHAGMLRRLEAVDAERATFTSANYASLLAELNEQGTRAVEQMLKAIDGLYSARAEWQVVRGAQEMLLRDAPIERQRLQHVPAPSHGLERVFKELDRTPNVNAPIRGGLHGET